MVKKSKKAKACNRLGAEIEAVSKGGIVPTSGLIPTSGAAPISDESPSSIPKRGIETTSTPSSKLKSGTLGAERVSTKKK